MNRYYMIRIFLGSLSLSLIFSAFSFNVAANGEGPPSPEIVFDGHNFTQNYWDIDVFNNSNWDHPDVNNMTSWLNNTWNIKWIKEGNFEMGMLAFINKTSWDNGENVIYTTPAQMWWQHAFKDGSEILIGSMHAAWFGFEDKNKNRQYDDSINESINPFFYMGVNNERMRNDVGIFSNPNVDITRLQRTEVGSIVTYTWGYNYTDIIFYVPRTNHSEIEGEFGFDWDFNYSDPGTYIDGSSAIGNQTFIAYEYTLTIDTALGVAEMHQNYISGEFGVLMTKSNETAPWQITNPGDPNYMPKNWSMCLGTWSFILAGQDYELEDIEQGFINATVHKTGLKEVQTTLGGVHAFDFKFNQKPTYQISNISDVSPSFDTYDVVYECLDVNNDREFVEYVSGMPQLVGDFGALVISYAINQTNHFTNGIPFDDIYENFRPNESAAFFITCYPEYGEYGGGILNHDPVFVAYFSPSSTSPPGIPGYPIGVLLITLSIGIVILIRYNRKLKIKS